MIQISKNILVTGGAGFIGSFIVDKLVEKGHNVRVFDNLDKQVHSSKPNYLNKKAEYVKGSVLDRMALAEAMKDVDIVFHEAAAVGVGQSMYKISHYTNVNCMGTANLLDILANERHDVKKIIVAASMSSYGEGLYNCKACGNVRPQLRPEEQLKNKKWEPLCPKCEKELKPVAIPETVQLNCNSIYALTKQFQEDSFLIFGNAYGIPVVALRYFNVYGPRQSLSNPYTGVAAIFISRIKNNNSPIIYEDGKQTRDFVSVHDIASANLMAMESSKADYEVFNVGTGQPLSILEITKTLIKIYSSNVKPKITGEFRKGDIRHCFADITKIKEKLGWRPSVNFEEGMKELISWSRGAEATDKFDRAAKELKDKGLV